MTEAAWMLPQADRRNERHRENVRRGPVVATGWPHQCRCGKMEIRAFRRRAYCARCGAAIRGCAYKANGRACPCRLPDPRETPINQPARVEDGAGRTTPARHTLRARLALKHDG